MPYKKHFWSSIFISLAGLLLFILANLFSFYAQSISFYQSIEWIIIFALFFWPSFFVVRYSGRNGKRLVRQSLYLALAFTITHILGLHLTFKSKAKARFAQSYFQCIPHAPFIVHTKWAQELTHSGYKKLPIYIQYAWYSFEDLCRMENLRAHLFQQEKTTKDLHSLYLDHLDYFDAESPLGTIGLSIAYDLSKEIRYRGLKSKYRFIASLKRIEQERILLNLLYQDLSKLYSMGEWISKAYLASTVEYKTYRFPSRAVASISEEDQKKIDEDIFDSSVFSLKTLIQFMKEDESQRKLWNFAKIKKVDHLIKRSISGKAREESLKEKKIKIAKMSELIQLSSIPSFEKKSFLNRIDQLHQRFGITK